MTGLRDTEDRAVRLHCSPIGRLALYGTITVGFVATVLSDVHDGLQEGQSRVVAVICRLIPHPGIPHPPVSLVI